MPPVTEMPDGELVELVKNGDEAAFRVILNRYREKVLAICLRMLKNRTEAEEAAQDTFVKIYMHVGDFDPARPFSAWAARIALNECRDRLRRRSRFKRMFREITDKDMDSRQSDASDEIAAKETVRKVEKAIDRLPGKLREVLILKAYADYSYEEIAQALNIRIGTVMSRLHRSREKLTEILKRSSET